MKYTNIRQSRLALMCIVTLAVAFCADHAFANSFDDGMAHTNSSDTTYNEPLYVGLFNPDNTLVVDSDSTLKVEKLVISSGEDSTNNLVSVVGGARLIAGESSTNGLTTGGIVVGDASGDSALTVNHASKLEGEYLYIGFGTNDSGKIELDGEGTEMAIAQDAYVGYAGSTNSVEIGDGAAMNIGGVLTVGLNSSNNHVNVSGTLFVNSTNDINVVDTDSDNGIHVKNGGTLQVGGDVETGTLADLGIDMQGKSTLELGGELTLSGNKIDDGHNVILNNTLSTHAATWQSSSLAIIGETTSYNSFTFTNGASGTASNHLLVGYAETANHNELNVGGTGSTFTATTDMAIGGSGKYNELNVADGGQVDAQGSLYIGYNTSATGNQANIGSNGVLNVVGDVLVGANGGSNKFNIDHGRVSVTNDFILGSGSANNRYNQTNGTNTVAGGFIIGRTEDATGKTGHVDDDAVETTGNLAIVGTNSTLDIQQNLTVGLEGGGSILTIRDGGTVNVSNDVVIGETVGDNYIYLQRGSNTQFNVTGNLVVGKEGGSNRFAAYGGTADIGGSLYLGASTNQHEIKNFIHLETTHAVLNVAGAIHIGASNSVNTLDLAKGATASAQDLFVGAYEGVSNNVVTVTGDDSLLSVSNQLAIGSNSGSNNAVNVGSGGILFVLNPTNIVIGTTATNDLNNRLNINSGGTLHTIDWDYAAVSTNIVLDSGSTLELDGVFSGTNQLDGGFELALNGATATPNWNTGTNVLYVGYETDGNTLTIKEGGLATTTTNLIVGNSSKSTGNTLSVTGLSSRVEIGNHLIVGNTGSSGNAMDILGGGQINATNNFILGSASDSNSGLLEGFAGTNSALNVMGDLTVGLKGDGNELQISSNAVVAVDGLATIGSDSDNNILRLTGSNAVLNVASNLVVGAKTATGNKLEITKGAATLDNDLIIGSHTNGNDNVVTVSGSNSTLNVGNDLIVGDIGTGNSLVITDGATNNIANNAWIGLASADNWIEARGTNSLLMVGNNLYVGSTNEASSGSRLGAYEAARIFIGGNLSMSTNGTIEIDYGAQIEVGNDYNQGEFSALSIRISTNSAITNLVVAGTANFAEDTIISVTSDGTISELVDEDGNTNKIERTIVAAGTLMIADQDATTDLLHSSINFQTNALVDFSYTVTNDTIFLDNFIKRSWADAAGLEGMLAKVADEIEGMAAMSNEFAQAMDLKFQDGVTDINKAMNDYYGKKPSSAPMHNVVNQGIGLLASELTVRSDTTRKRATAPVPSGASGPHAWNQELQGWIAGYGSWGTKDGADGFHGYDANLSGFVIGADLAVSKNILVGLAGGSNYGDVDKNNGASGDTKTTYGAAYASVGTKDWFLDSSVIYGSSSINNTLGDVFDTTASYDARNLAFYLGGGKEIIGKYLVITPEASLLANQYEQDAYDEKSSDAVARSVDSFDALYVQSSLGCSLGLYTAMGEVVLKPELRAHWLHEFSGEESLPYRLIGGDGTPYNMLLQAPEEDILKLGAGIAAKMSEYLDLRFDLDTRLGSDYSDYTVTGSLRYQF